MTDAKPRTRPDLKRLWSDPEWAATVMAKRRATLRRKAGVALAFVRTPEEPDCLEEFDAWEPMTTREEGR